MTREKQAMQGSTEFAASSHSGYPYLLTIPALIGSVILFIYAAKNDYFTLVFASIALFVLTLFIAGGFYLIGPNQAVAIQLFGSYKGTDRNHGLRWVLPWMMRKTISVRIHNTTSHKIKVNDLRGNPVEIATNVVWRVNDTARALFDVEDYAEFVDIQIESAVRLIGARYPYDNFEADEVTLRGDGEEISHKLELELHERVSSAGIDILECRLTHLAYAPEIAHAMLRRQQAEAVIAARAKMVEGAVTMVEHALEQLSAKHVVELDDERRAAMVSNLMVVLCGDRDTQPVVNAGSLYQ